MIPDAHAGIDRGGLDRVGPDHGDRDHGDRDQCDPDFAEPIASGGYLWWYIDGISDDGRYGVTIIAFVGSVFSPYYRRALKRGAADPENHVAINVVLYGPGGRWAMTERGKRQLERSSHAFRVGPSRLRWRDGMIEATIDERCAPLPRRLRGVIRLRPAALTGRSFALDEAGLHLWRPIAPVGRIEVELEDPGLSWSGSGYLDSNRGERLPEHDFESWDWSRSPSSDGARILYDMRRREGGRKILALRARADGSIDEFEPPAEARLPPGFAWRARRSTLCDAGHRPEVIETLEDTPFYTRSLVRTRLEGETLTSFHESLMLDRLTQPWVQRLLPFRMPRWTMGGETAADEKPSAIRPHSEPVATRQARQEERGRRGAYVEIVDPTPGSS